MTPTPVVEPAESAPAPAGPWAVLRRRLDFSQYVPRPSPPVESRQTHSPRWGRLLVLKSAAGKYVQLSERDEFIYRHMDGTRTVQDLVLSYFHRFESFALDRVSALVHRLLEAGLLEDRPIEAFRALAARLERRRPEAVFARLARMFVEHRIEIRGLDRVLTFAYKALFWPFFTRPAYAAYIVLAAIGTAAFAKVLAAGEFKIGDVFTTEGSVAYGALLLAAAMTVLGAVHQLAHVFAAKALGREVPSAGLIITYGLPFVYAETTDVWLEPRLPRMLSSLAGTVSDLVMGSAAALFMVAFPDSAWRGLAFKLAAVSYAALFMDLNPLFELDGYYALEDYLEMPGLRSRAFAFLRRELRRKLSRRERFDRDELILAWYGVLALAWLAVIIVSALVFLAMQTRSALSNILSGSSWASAAVAVGVMAFFVIPVTIALLAGAALAVLRAVRWVRTHPAFRDPRRLARLILGASGAACATVLLVPAAARELVRLPLAQGVTALGEMLPAEAFFPVWGLVYPALVPGLAAAAWALAVFAAREVRGSRLERSLRLLTVFLALELARSTLESYSITWGLFTGPVALAARALETASFLALLGWAIHLLVRVNWPIMGTAGRALSSLAAAGAAAASVAVAARWGPPGVGAAQLAIALAAGSVALAALAPPLLSYSGAPLWGGWVLLFAGTGARALAGLARVTGHELSLVLPTELAQLAPTEPQRLVSGWKIALAGMQVELLGAVLLLAAVASFASLLRRLTVRVARAPREDSGRPSAAGERERLVEALEFLFSALARGLAQAYGRSSAEAIVNSANRSCQSAGLPVRLAAGELLREGVAAEGGVRPGSGLRESAPDIIGVARAGRFALAELERRARSTAGEDFFKKLLSAAYDALYWNERESVYEHVLRGFPWAAEVARTSRLEAASLDALIEGAPLFEGLSAEERKELASRMRPVRAGPGEVVVREGETAGSFFLVARGELEVYHEEAPHEVLATLSTGDYFGEAAALEGARRSASVRAKSDCELLELSGADFRAFARSHVDVAQKVSEAGELVSLLRRMPAFGELPLAQVALLASAMRPVRVSPGEEVVRQGEPGSSLYVVRRGELEVVIKREGAPARRVAVLGPGEYFGEIALVERTNRTATVRALTDCELSALSREDFDRRVGKSLAALAAFGRISSRRRREIREREAETATAIALTARRGHQPGRVG